MANEGSSPLNRTISFVLRPLVGLLLPIWGLVIIILGVIAGMGWWIATGTVVLAIGIVRLAGGSLVTPFLGGRTFG
jgi:hypothetical protein